MTREVHGIVEHAQNFYSPRAVGAKDNEMTTTTILPRDMERPDTRAEFVAGARANNIRPADQGFKGG